MKQAELTLEEVKESFSNWRYNRRGGEGIPNYLWEQVKILLTTHERVELMRHLKLTTHQFREKGLIPAKEDNNNIEASHSFVQIPFPHSSVLERQVESKSRLTIQRGDTQLCLTQPSDDQVQLIINMLLR
jgi:hypothetical protein